MSIDSAQTRATFLRRAAGLSALVAGGGVAFGHTADAWGASQSTTLGFVGWQGYDGTPPASFPDLVDWESKAGIALNATYIDNNPQIITKIQASPAGTYDICTPIHTIVPALAAAGLIEPLPMEKLKNWSSIYPSISKLPFLRGSTAGTLNAVPLGFGWIQYPMVNPKLVKRVPTSWSDLSKPEFRKKYAISDLPENLTWIARTLHYGHPDPHHITKKELANCVAYARQVVKNAKTVASSNGDLLQLLVTKEIALSVDGSPDFVDKAKAQGVNLKRFIPREGTAGAYMDNLSIPKGSNNVDLTLSWIDQMISPQTNAEVAGIYGGASTNRKSRTFLPAPLQARYPLDHIADFFVKAPVYPPQPTQSKTFANYSDWVKAWALAKQG